MDVNNPLKMVLIGIDPYPVGMMTFPTEWKNKSHVPNQQPEKCKNSAGVGRLSDRA